MAVRLWLATRKGLLRYESAGAGQLGLGHVAFLGDPVSAVLVGPAPGTVYAALALGHFGAKLRRSLDDGRTWHDVAVPAYPEDASLPPNGFAAPGDPRSRERPAVLSEIWCLEGADPAEPDALWAGTIPGGLFRSRDAGQTWDLMRGLWDRPERVRWFGGGKDEPGIHSVCVDPRDPRRLVVGVSCGGVWSSDDGGETWQLASAGLRAAYTPPEFAHAGEVQDPHRVAMCAAAPDVLWCQHHNGMFHSTNRGESWREIVDVRPSTFGFAVAAHPHDPLTAWFVPAEKDECRVPVDGRLVVTRTRDGGQSFEALTRGLPPSGCFDLIYRHALAVDASGTRLAMGSTTGSLWVSDDGGESWQELSSHLPPIYAVRWSE